MCVAIVIHPNRIFAAALADLVRASIPTSSVNIAADLAALAAGNVRFDLIIAGIIYCDGNLIEALTRNRFIRQRTERILVLAEERHRCLLRYIRGLRVGGIFDLSGDLPEHFGFAVRQLLRGRTYFSPGVAELVANQYVSASPSTKRLSLREQLVLALVGAGLRDDRIAVQIGSTTGAVRSITRSIRRKFGAENSSALVVIAASLGLVYFTPAGPVSPVTTILLRELERTRDKADLRTPVRAA